MVTRTPVSFWNGSTTVVRTPSANDPPQVVTTSSLVILSCASNARGTRKLAAANPASVPPVRSTSRRERRRLAGRSIGFFDMSCPPLSACSSVRLLDAHLYYWKCYRPLL